MSQWKSRIACLVTAGAVLGTTPLHAEEAAKFGMEDLQALAEQESWQELLAHMNDIAPRLRKKEWKTLLGQAAVGQVAALAEVDDKWGALGTLDALVVQYPLLKKDKGFLEKRAEVGLKAFEACFANAYGGAECSEKLLAFVKVDADNSKLAFEAGRLTRLRGGPGFALPMFAQAVRDKKQVATYCEDDQLWLAVSWILGGSGGAAAAKTGQDIAFKSCFKQLKNKLVDELLDGNAGYARNTCGGLGKAKALTPFQTAWCKDQSKGS